MRRDRSNSKLIRLRIDWERSKLFTPVFLLCNYYVAWNAGRTMPIHVNFKLIYIFAEWAKTCHVFVTQLKNNYIFDYLRREKRERERSASEGLHFVIVRSWMGTFKFVSKIIIKLNSRGLKSKMFRCQI